MRRTMINGAPGETVSVLDRGFQYGDGVFETIAVTGGCPRRWRRHLARLEEGARRLGFAPPDSEQLGSEATALCRDADRAVLKIVVTRGLSLRGYRPAKDAVPTRALMLFDWPEWPGDPAEHGVRVTVCAQRLSSNLRLAGIKHLNRLEQVLARAEWQDQWAEGLMMNARDEIVEGTMSNLFAVIDGVLTTPDLTQAGVAGIVRGLVLERAGAVGMTTRVGPVCAPDLSRASEVFLTNSVIGIWPVREIAGIGEYQPGAVSRRLAEELAQAD